MGYADTIPLTFFEYGNYRQVWPDITVGTVAADNMLGFLYLPSYLAGARHAYLDIYFPYCNNTAVAANYIDGDQYIQVLKTWGGTWTNAIILKSATYNFPPGEKIDVGRQVGYYDIEPQVNDAAGVGLYVRWAAAAVHADSVIFKNIYCILRVAT